MANAAGAADAVTTFSPMATPDSLTVTDLPEQHKGSVPRPSEQLAKLNQVHELNKLNELHQVTDLAAPTLGRLGAVE